MKVVDINVVPYGSTGMIAKSICKLCNLTDEAYFCYSWTKKNGYKVNDKEILIGSFLGKAAHIALSKITGFELNFSLLDTIIFINKLKKIKPDIVHINILHSYYINVPILFKYLNNNNIKVVWTFHDCWAFTGHCPHFQIKECDKWMTRCYNCPSYREYPQSLFDNSSKMYDFKKKWFTYLKNLTIVCPSKWMADLCKKSFFKNRDIRVINNGIDLEIFKYRNSEFRIRYKLENKIIILGVALDWGYRKGIDIFKQLAVDLPDKYCIVLVGTNDSIDKELPSNIISIHRTFNQIELSEIYSASDLFVNPTREDTFPTVNIESLACELPVITFNTGGSPEIVNKDCGFIIKNNNYKCLLKCILDNSDAKIRLRENCRKTALNYNQKEKYEEYINLFKNIL